MKHILVCKDCGVYTIKDKCPKCGKGTIRKIPPKYSPDDKYGKYRRKVKFQSLKRVDLI